MFYKAVFDYDMLASPIHEGGCTKESNEPFCDLVSLILYAGVERSWMGVEIDPNERLVPP